MKVAIITGASVGIGQAAAQLFLDDDFTVYNLSRRECPLPGVQNISCDLASEASVSAATTTLADAIAGSESVSIVYNASQMRKDSVDDCASEAMRAVLETNVVAINSINQALIAQLPPTSSILYIGSTLSEKAVGGSFSYVTSKHAQLGMMRATCQDLMGRGVHTALICPGFTDTEMLRTHIGNDPEIVQAIGAMNSFGRLIEPGEIAELIHWSHNNPVINGAVLHANLGQKEA
ncbi:MAG: SDR family oxidoreductase [Halieaceae bacterium]